MNRCNTDHVADKALKEKCADSSQDNSMHSVTVYVITVYVNMYLPGQIYVNIIPNLPDYNILAHTRYFPDENEETYDL